MTDSGASPSAQPLDLNELRETLRESWLTTDQANALINEVERLRAVPLPAPQQKEQDDHTRVVGVPSDSPMGSTASGNEVIP